MPRLLRFILLLIILSALTLLIAHLLGEARPASQLTAVMSGADGAACKQPCLFGVRPGETSLEQAAQILHSHPLTHDAKWLDDHTLQLSGPAAYIVFSLTPDNLIDTMIFTDNLNDSGVPVPDSLVDSITVGDVLLAFGTPSISLPSSAIFVMDFDALGVTTAIARPENLKMYVRPNTPVNMIMMAALYPCPTPIVFEVHYWMGFKTFKQYMDDRRSYRLPHRFSVIPGPYAICLKSW